MNTETLKKIAGLAYPDADVEILPATWIEKGKAVNADVVCVDLEWFVPFEDAELELKLIRMYREWLKVQEGNHLVTCQFYDADALLMKALESTRTLLEAIERDMIRKVDVTRDIDTMAETSEALNDSTSNINMTKTRFTEVKCSDTGEMVFSTGVKPNCAWVNRRGILAHIPI